MSSEVATRTCVLCGETTATPSWVGDVAFKRGCAHLWRCFYDTIYHERVCGFCCILLAASGPRFCSLRQIPKLPNREIICAESLELRTASMIGRLAI